MPSQLSGKHNDHKSIEIPHLQLLLSLLLLYRAEEAGLSVAGWGLLLVKANRSRFLENASDNLERFFILAVMSDEFKVMSIKPDKAIYITATNHTHKHKSLKN